jgi:hypothetical protein
MAIFTTQPRGQYWREIPAAMEIINVVFLLEPLTANGFKTSHNHLRLNG